MQNYNIPSLTEVIIESSGVEGVVGSTDTVVVGLFKNSDILMTEGKARKSKEICFSLMPSYNIVHAYIAEPYAFKPIRSYNQN